jgi:phage portal protein BeeE
LIAPEERARTFTRFDLSDLLRGDSAARANYYDTLVKSGIISINEARRMEDMNSVENGDLNMVQVNQVSLQSFGDYSAKISSDDNAGN